VVFVTWGRKKEIPKTYRDPMSSWRLYSENDFEKIKKISGRGWIRFKKRDEIH